MVSAYFIETLVVATMHLGIPHYHQIVIHTTIHERLLKTQLHHHNLALEMRHGNEAWV